MTVQSGTTGDMFQAYLLNVAFSCMDAFSVTLLKSIKKKKAGNCQQVGQVGNEYDH